MKAEKDIKDGYILKSKLLEKLVCIGGIGKFVSEHDVLSAENEDVVTIKEGIWIDEEIWFRCPFCEKASFCPTPFCGNCGNRVKVE